MGREASAAEDLLEFFGGHVGFLVRGSELVALFPVLPEAIVATTLLRIGENLVGFGDSFESSLGFGSLALGVAIGVPLERELAVGLLDVVGTGVARNAEHVVIVLKLHATTLA